MKFEDLKVGMRVLIKCEGAFKGMLARDVEAIIGEIDEDNTVFLHSNASELSGTIGEVKPSANGCKYSYMLGSQDEPYLECIYPMDETVETKPEKKREKISLMKVSFERENSKLMFAFEIDQRLTDIFKEMSEEIKTSESWKGLKFYYIPSLTTQSSYKSMLRSYNLFDDYGQPLYKDGLFNIAWIRTVGGKGSMHVKEVLNEEEFKSFLRNAVGFLRAYYESALRDTKLTATLELEI